jgi:hypothetical protein
MECPNCKAEMSGKFCRHCGSAATLPSRDANLASLCPSCGASVPPTAKFCSKCGAALISSQRNSVVQASHACEHCGTPMKQQTRFCKSCGMPTSLSDSGGFRMKSPPAPSSIDRAPISSFSSPPPFEASALPTETDYTAYPEISSPPSTATRPAPDSFPEFESRTNYQQEPPTTSVGPWRNNKAILLTGVALVGLVAGGLTYWFVLRKPAANAKAKIAPAPAVSRPAASAPGKPSPSQPSMPTPDTSVPAAQPGEASTTKPLKTASHDQSPAGSVPAQPDATSQTALPSDLSGSWKGEYTNHNQVTKVTLELSKDSADLFAGTLTFDPGGTNSASCALTGVYNPKSKFMLLKVANCQGHPPAYLQGKIGFSSVELSATQVFGVDSAHNSLLNISRQ